MNDKSRFILSICVLILRLFVFSFPLGLERVDSIKTIKDIIMKLTDGKKVFLGTTGMLSFAAVTFFGFQNKKTGHNLFDQSR